MSYLILCPSYSVKVALPHYPLGCKRNNTPIEWILQFILLSIITTSHAVLNLYIYDCDGRGSEEAYKEMPFYIILVEFVHHICTHFEPLAYTSDNITYTCHIYTLGYY